MFYNHDYCSFNSNNFLILLSLSEIINVTKFNISKTNSFNRKEKINFTELHLMKMLL